MFRLDDKRVVDATVGGGLARYVNHSCDPNCVTEIVEVERDLKIIIMSNRKILRGEEVGYIFDCEIFICGVHYSFYFKYVSIINCKYLTKGFD